MLKTLGLYLRENITTGRWSRSTIGASIRCGRLCGALETAGGDPHLRSERFFLPIDRFNERFEELNNHPDWSFHGRDFPRNEDLLAARNRVFARHPQTQFIALHVGNFAENLRTSATAWIATRTCHVELAARIGELGRQPRASRSFFDKYQDRIMFGTDAVPQATRRRSRSSATCCTRSTSGSSRPKTSTSTTRRPRFPRKAVGASTDSASGRSSQEGVLRERGPPAGGNALGGNEATAVVVTEAGRDSDQLVSAA